MNDKNMTYPEFGFPRIHRTISINHVEWSIVENVLGTRHVYGCDLSSFLKERDENSFLYNEHETKLLKACETVEDIVNKYMDNKPNSTDIQNNK